MATTYPTTAETRNTVPQIPRAQDASIRELDTLLQWAIDTIVALEAKVGADSSAVTTSLDYKTATARRYQTVKSQIFDLDNGAAATVDETLMRLPFAVTLRAARIVYDDATTGTVAGGNIKLGGAVDDGSYIAATAYENAKAVGTSTACTILTSSVAANQALFVRHTGVAATQAGKAHLEVDYTID